MRFSSSFANRPWRFYAAWLIFWSLCFLKPLLALGRYALRNDNASHILLVPFIVAWLLYLDRQKVAARRIDSAAAAWLAVPAALFCVILTGTFGLGESASLSLVIFAYILLLVAGFAAVFGRASARSVWFDLAFLLFLVPWPEPVLNRVIYLLQTGSATVAEFLFDLSGVPLLRQGFIFRLPRLSIEVAQECSGIRSSMALLVLALLIAHFSFSKFWKKALFVFLGLLMMMVKNGVRIVTLTLLASYVDPAFLYGRLHRDGGIVFFLFGLALLWPVYWWLRRGEQSTSSERRTATVSGAAT